MSQGNEMSVLFQGNALTVFKIAGNCAELCFDAKGSVNKFDIATLDELSEALNYLEESKVEGLVLTSAKSAFIVGADITEFLSLFALPKPELDNWLIKANDVFNRLEDLPFPTVSAIQGYALGGGCECILATDLRVASLNARIGLPETKLGIMPGFGGTVRLPRLIGADAAMELITQGKDLKASAALKQGLVDSVVEREQLKETAITLLQRSIQGEINWQARRQQKQQPLSLSAIEQAMSFTTAKGLVALKAGPHYPAPHAVVKTLEKAASLSRDEALNIEREIFIELTQTDVAKALVGIFLNDQYVKGLAKKASQQSQSIQHAAVLGAGIMGGGIAYQSASKGVPAVMKDIQTTALELGMGEASKLLNKQLERGRMDGMAMAKILSSIQPTLEYSTVKHADIVVEAVVENPKVKATVLHEVEQVVSPTTVITSNTSTIPISQLAQSLARPEQFCGMHFFNPVHRMPLVEVIRGEKTSEATIQRVVAYAAQIGKTPIVVNDCPGFFVNRVLFPYFAGFSQLVEDGADFQHVDKVMEKQFGWPMGPAYLLDVVGIDTAHHCQVVMENGFPDRMSQRNNDSIQAMYHANRFGQKNGQGFYAYQMDKKGRPKKTVDEVAQNLIAEQSKPSQPFQPFHADEIIDRMMLPMITEVVRCLEEGIIASPAEADMALVYGLGFPPFRGGIFRYIDTIGIQEIVARCDRYQHLGPLYQATDQMREKANKNETYYSQNKPLAAQ